MRSANPRELNISLRLQPLVHRRDTLNPYVIQPLEARPVTLETADLLAIAGIVLPLLLAVVGGTLAWLKSDIRDLRTESRAETQALRAEIRAVNGRVDVLTQAILASALARGPLVATPEAATSPSATESQPTPTN